MSCHAPFLAFPLVGAVACTFGGLATDDGARVGKSYSRLDGTVADIAQFAQLMRVFMRGARLFMEVCPVMLGRSATRFLRYILNIDPARPEGTTSAERDCLARFASGKRRAVEIGVAEGVSASAIREALHPDGVLYGVDPFTTGRLGVNFQKLIAARELRPMPGRAAVELLAMTSEQAESVLSGTFDFVFIDGDHSFESVSRDWAHWSARIKPAGIICLHDTKLSPDAPKRGGAPAHYERVASRDPRFKVVAEVEALAVLQRL